MLGKTLANSEAADVLVMELDISGKGKVFFTNMYENTSLNRLESDKRNLTYVPKWGELKGKKVDQAWL